MRITLLGLDLLTSEFLEVSIGQLDSGMREWGELSEAACGASTSSQKIRSPNKRKPGDTGSIALVVIVVL